MSARAASLQRTDAWLGAALVLLASAVLWSASGFPDVPGQDVGAGFLPMIVGAGLLACGVGLLLRSRRAGAYTTAYSTAYADAGAAKPAGSEHFGSAGVILGVIVAYVALAERLGFLLVAPVCLLAVFKALRVRTGPAVLWAVLGTLAVHLAFYKLLRVPLPWGVLRPWY